MTAPRRSPEGSLAHETRRKPPADAGRLLLRLPDLIGRQPMALGQRDNLLLDLAFSSADEMGREAEIPLRQVSRDIAEAGLDPLQISQSVLRRYSPLSEAHCQVNTVPVHSRLMEPSTGRMST